MLCKKLSSAMLCCFLVHCHPLTARDVTDAMLWFQVAEVSYQVDARESAAYSESGLAPTTACRLKNFKNGRYRKFCNAKEIYESLAPQYRRPDNKIGSDRSSPVLYSRRAGLRDSPGGLANPPETESGRADPRPGSDSIFLEMIWKSNWAFSPLAATSSKLDRPSDHIERS
eukprot:1191639-Prorocentrum_minimum.AAC.6